VTRAPLRARPLARPGAGIGGRSRCCDGPRAAEAASSAGTVNLQAKARACPAGWSLNLMPKFDYARYFNRIREIERLVIPAEKINWLERYSKPDKPVEVLLYLGCNVLMTAHLAWEVVKVFEAIGVSFAAAGGPQFCCGIMQYGHQDRAASARLTKATIGKFESFGEVKLPVAAGIQLEPRSAEA
jgi:Fe-S oxidoreductase